MRERLQKYNFEIEYTKGKDLVDADAISRIHQTHEDESSKNVLMEAYEVWYWKTEDNEIKIFPKVEERE